MSKHTPEAIQPQLPFEEWRDIPGYEGLYQVSNHGKIKRLQTRVRTKGGGTVTHRGGNKTLGLKNGYYYLWLFKNNEGRKYYVHELVALTFIGPRPDGHDVHHKNENELDNLSDNLEYLQNLEHKSHHNKGEKSVHATVTGEQAKTIKALCRTMRVIDVANSLRVSYHVVWYIKHGKTWKHIT